MISIKLRVVMLCLLFIVTDISVQAQEVLKMGVFPRRNSVVTVKMFTPLVNYLSKELGVKVQLETAKSFSQFWENVLSERYDIVHYNQLHYILSHKSAGYDVFAKNEEFGLSNINSAIVVRKDSGIENVSQLKGKKIIFGGGKLAMVAFVGTKLILMENGLKESDYTTIIARNPPNSSLATFYKKADAGGVGDIALNVPSVTKRINAQEMKYLIADKPQAHIPWAYKADCSEALKEKIRIALTSLSSTEEGKKILKKAGMTGILPATDQDYDASRKMYKAYLKRLKD